MDDTKRSDEMGQRLALRQEAARLGFSALGIAAAKAVPPEVQEGYRAAVSDERYDGLGYLRRNESLRFDPRELLPGCQSLIVVALNYYPKQKQKEHTPRVSIYAYGRDYHKVMKKRLDKLLDFIKREIDPLASGRSFADSAPILERYWAVEAGLGWRGKNGLLILPGMGTYHFLGILLVSTPFVPDGPLTSRCGDCRRCIDACPTQALATDGSGRLAADRCLSYLTIEQPNELTPEQTRALGDRLYGCDTCQEVCPHNCFARPTEIADFAPKPALFELTYDRLSSFDESDYLHFFAGTAVKRAGYDGILRNIRALLADETNNEDDE